MVREKHSDLTFICSVFFIHGTATTETYTLSLHDALPISYTASWKRRTKATDACSSPSARPATREDRKSTRLNSSHVRISYAVFCLKKKKESNQTTASRAASCSPAPGEGPTLPWCLRGTWS